MHLHVASPSACQYTCTRVSPRAPQNRVLLLSLEKERQRSTELQAALRAGPVQASPAKDVDPDVGQGGRGLFTCAAAKTSLTSSLVACILQPGPSTHVWLYAAPPHPYLIPLLSLAQPPLQATAPLNQPSVTGRGGKGACVCGACGGCGRGRQQGRADVEGPVPAADQQDCAAGAKGQCCRGPAACRASCNTLPATLGIGCARAAFNRRALNRLARAQTCTDRLHRAHTHSRAAPRPGVCARD